MSVHYREWEKQLDPEFLWSFGSETFAIHLWNEMWRRANIDKDASWPSGSLYEQLKTLYLANTHGAAPEWNHHVETARPRPAASLHRPSVSVVVPTCNPRLDLLHGALESLAGQTMAASDFEVVVVDNNSNVPVERASLSWSSAADLRVVREPLGQAWYMRESPA